VGWRPLGADDGGVFCAGGVDPVAIPRQQLFEAIAGLLDILHHQEMHYL
jgi:hypothetical protein